MLKQSSRTLDIHMDIAVTEHKCRWRHEADGGHMLLGSYSVEAGISQHVQPMQTISCEECLDVSCENVTKVWQPLSGNGPVWSRGSLGNAIPECGIYTPPSGTWYHVCKKKHVFMVTNDSVAGLTFIFETPERALRSERKTGEECPMLESELESEPKEIEFLTLEPEEAGNVPQAEVLL
ncbi:hypothetical protein COCON_G00002430 [Conger conger]|uniref:Uncharacterized protein n=1 Tax=Conger conger TaxID=82655 RepID=A0A9Q1E0Y1_CONCO|nr:hypothetical protein COCON_G00002430 [Conger conger]